MPFTRRDFLKASAAAGVVAGSGLLLARRGVGGGAVTLFTNGTIYVDAATSVRNLLVQDGTVIGTDVNPGEWPSAQRVDLQGGTAYPGFIDSHVHLLEAGTVGKVGGYMRSNPQTGAQVAAELLEISKAHPGAKALLGFGLTPPDFDGWSLADLAAIDAVVPDRVAIVFDWLGHNCAVNGFAMRKFDVERKSVPFGGKAVREGGKLTGMFRESAMNLVATAALAEFDDADVKSGTLEMARMWAAKGYTGVVDLMGGPGLHLIRPHVLRELEREGKLPLRVHYCHTLLGVADLEVAAGHAGRDTDLVRFVGGKLFVDGAFAGGQAWTSWPHVLPAGSHGVPQVTLDDSRSPELNVNRIVARAEELGLNMHYHAQGDLAIQAVLDALDRVLDATGKLRGVHTLIHLAYPTGPLIDHLHAINARAGGLHVVTTTQPAFWDVEGATAKYYGDAGADSYPVRKLVDSGVSVGISTDYWVSPLETTSPTAIAGIAATGGKNPERHPAIRVQDVVHGLTVGSARTTGSRDVGALRVGYKADLVVYDTDLYRVPPAEFTAGNPGVRSTWVGGRRVV